MSDIAVEDGGRTESLGSGLDEIGFKPLGRRIIIGKPVVGDDSGHASGPLKRAASRTPGGIASADDPLGYYPSDPEHALKVAKSALSGEGDDLVFQEVQAALRRWKLLE